MKPLRLAILRSVTLAFLGCPAFLSSGQTVSNVTATASSGLYWVMNGTNVIVDRRPQYACDGSGLFGGSSGDEEHVSHEGTAWESVGNGWTEQVGIPGGDDPAPWIKFTFTQAYSISSFSAWNFGEPPHAIYRTAVFADDTNFLGTFTFDTNSSSAQDTLKQTFQLPTPVTAASMTFVVQQNGGGITFPTITNGLATLVGIGEMRFYCTPVLLLSPVPSGSGVGITWISQTNYSYQLESTADLRPPAAWTNDGAPLLGNGDILSVFRPSDSGNKFFRVRVSP